MPAVALVAWVGSLAIAAVGSGCASAESVEARSPRSYAESAQREYERAVKALTDRNWELVDPLFNEVRRKYPYSRYARLAELRMADADYEQESFAEAIAGYKAFVREYPNDAEVPYARFRIAKAQYQSVSQSLLLPPLEERDLGTVNDALETITDYLEDFPQSEHAEELRYMLEVVVGLLARHELYVARYYLREDRFEAAEARVRHALEVLPESGLEPEALVLLGEIHLRQKRRDEAREAFARVLAEHPDSPFTVPARNHLARLGESVGTLRIPSQKAKPEAVTR
ncbi:MAG: outer membrane protein assembly factor BamD [Pseudomonadota bacterium]